MAGQAHSKMGLRKPMEKINKIYGPLAQSIAKRMSMHRGKPIELVKARVERFNDQEIFVEVFENVRNEDMFIVQSTSNPANDP